jgi:iron complex outermembrane receptor protein
VESHIINDNILFGAPAGLASARFRCANLTAPGYSGTSTYPYTADQRFGICQQDLRKSTKAPTWLINLDYKPVDDVMIYAKWARGYRQGGVTIFGPDPVQPFDAEKVDSYEVGLKASWRGAVPGYFNISGYYNDFRNQQLLVAVSCVSNMPGFTVPCSGNAAVINAGKSRMYGLEAEAGVTPFEGLRLEASYGYLNSKLLAFNPPAPGSLAPYNLITSPPVGGVIPNAGPEHKLVLSGTYRLPFPQEIGRLSVGGTWVYQSAYRAANDSVPGSNAGILPSARILNLNINWEGVASLPIDASFFMTNVTNEKIYLHINDNTPRGFISYLIGEPRMWGVRLRYKFGS